MTEWVPLCPKMRPDSRNLKNPDLCWLEKGHGGDCIFDLTEAIRHDSK